ncbi:hypothetical protein [Rhodopirellula sp. SWK7]|uniref:hypothetical protein n=1 Tax=Rhodopirellula sp. SWK7 TaxID=595460 RepID=UPI0002BE7E44|nr:hypothetical protein [Rhodopirellula sp. SWK7]EMI44164.1 hypothetical protein RRSWK_03359 [Rhodopirellula sp. SWK7]
MLDSLWEWLADSLADCDVDSDCDWDSDSDSLDSESLTLLADEFQLYEGALSEPDSLRDSLADVLDSDWLDSDVDDSLVDDSLSDADDCELLMDGVLVDSLDSEADEPLDEPESLDCDLLDDESLADELAPETLGRLIDVLESLDSLVDESLDWESDELSDESLDADDDPSELDEPLMLG